MPDWRTEIRRRLSAIQPPLERHAAILDELAEHLEDHYQTLLVSGASPAEAEASAWRELEGDGDLGRLLSAVEPRNRPSLAELEVAPGGRLLQGLGHDVRYAVRNLRKRAMLSATIMVIRAQYRGGSVTALDILRYGVTGAIITFAIASSLFVFIEKPLLDRRPR